MNKVIYLFLLIPVLLWGQTLYVFDDFEDGQFSDHFGSFNPDNVSISTTYAYSGIYSVRMYGGTLGAALDWSRSFAYGSTCYIRYKIYYPAGYPYTGVSGSGGHKMIRGMPGDGPIWTFNNSYGFQTIGFFDPITVNAVPASKPISWVGNGVWHTYEMYWRYHDNQGFFWWVCDGDTIAGNARPQYDTWYPYSITALRLCGGNGQPSGSYYYVDDVEIWSSYPGAPPSEPDTIKPTCNGDLTQEAVDSCGIYITNVSEDTDTLKVYYPTSANLLRTFKNPNASWDTTIFVTLPDTVKLYYWARDDSSNITTQTFLDSLVFLQSESPKTILIDLQIIRE